MDGGWAKLSWDDHVEVFLTAPVKRTKKNRKGGKGKKKGSTPQNDPVRKDMGKKKGFKYRSKLHVMVE